MWIFTVAINLNRELSISYPKNPVKRFVISIPIIGMIAFWGFRFLLGFARLKKVCLGFMKWLIHSKEWTNLTYELTDESYREMTGFFHVITGEDRKKLKEYLNECLHDEVLYSHVSRITSGQPFYMGLVRFHHTDSLSFLSSFDENIDIIIQDADHSYDYQIAEYMAVFPKMSHGGLIISDIDNKSSALMDFAEDAGEKYFTWLERPKNPFYIPGGIGVIKKGGGSL